MEAPPTTVQKPATTQDAVLGLAPSTRSAGDAEQFDKIFEDASQKMKTEEEDTAKRSEEDEEQNTRKKDNAPKKHKEEEASEALTGLVRATELQKETAKKVIKAEAVQKQEVATPTEVQPKLKKVESKQTTETSQEAKAQAALKRQQQRTATRARNRVQEFQQLTKADQAKAEQVREQNTLSKPATTQLNPVLKEMTTQSATKDGTQVAPKTDNMTMPSKPLAPKPEAKPVLVEELRPATGAETSPRSGQQSAQQDLPKETPKETVLPVTSVQSATPAATGVTPAQAAAAPQGALNPMLEKIWDAVTTFRVRGENEMTVKVQPDNDTEMQLTIKYGNGGVEIEARMQQGDGRQLASGWNELQQQLSERGVNLGDLASEDSEETTRDSDPRQFNRQGQPQSHPTEFQIGDEEADWAALGMAATRDKEPTRTTAPESTDKVEEAYDGWQSWA
ncbi:MAG: hypothetical protein ACJZ8W_03910 [Limisphaerales bacterium]